MNIMLNLFYLIALALIYAFIATSVVANYSPFMFDEFSNLLSFVYVFPVIFIVILALLLFLRNKTNRNVLIALSIIPAIFVIYFAYNFLVVRPRLIQEMRQINSTSKY